MPPPNISGADAVAWFDRLPSFQGAEILSIHLNRRGPSILRIHAWDLTTDVPGLLARDGDAIVVFEFEGIQRLRLEGEEEGDRSVIRGLKVGLTEQGYRLELFPSRGIGGEIVADDIAIRIEGGR
jgi:hypothetical protein